MTIGTIFPLVHLRYAVRMPTLGKSISAAYASILDEKILEADAKLDCWPELSACAYLFLLLFTSKPGCGLTSSSRNLMRCFQVDVDVAVLKVYETHYVVHWKTAYELIGWTGWVDRGHPSRSNEFLVTNTFFDCPAKVALIL